jgi:phosphoglycerate dehydrogenase-like enzyme
MTFKVGLSSDLKNLNGDFSWGDIKIQTLEPLNWSFLSKQEKNFTPEMVAGFDGIAFAGPGVDSGSFDVPENSPLIIARFGVGYDNIDLDVCTRAGVALTITPDGSKKPVATAALTLTLATLHRLNAKMNLAKTNNWNARLDQLGKGLNNKTVGTIGFGNIASEFFRLISPFDCKKLSFDPWKTQSDADPHGVRLVSLEELLGNCDVIVVLATLTPETKHLISYDQFKLMKKTSVLINISRGPIVDEIALTEALNNGQIYGAGLDVFEIEPTHHENPLLSMDSVVATPHNLAWTDELGSGMGLSAFTSIKKISQGQIPEFVVNKEVLDTPQFKAKLSKWL